MTLVLSYITRGYAFQVSDRLLTRRIGTSQKQFDVLSNKNVVYLARDALVSLGYTGWAYLDGIPTDQWIAQKLAGDDLSEVGTLRLTVGPMPVKQSLYEATEL